MNGWEDLVADIFAHLSPGCLEEAGCSHQKGYIVVILGGTWGHTLGSNSRGGLKDRRTYQLEIGTGHHQLNGFQIILHHLIAMCWRWPSRRPPSYGIAKSQKPSLPSPLPITRKHHHHPSRPPDPQRSGTPTQRRHRP